MHKKILISGVMGGIVFILWALVCNVGFGFKARLDMNQVPNESEVYAVLKANIVEPGGYVCNPQLTASGVFPLDEPVYSIRYSGMGHEAAGFELIMQLVAAVIAAMIAAWMLSVSSPRMLSTYFRRVVFFVAIGFLFVVFSDLAKFGIGGYPLRSMLLLAANDLISWLLVGLVVAWRITPEVAEKATP